jgi:nucleoside-diphosphate-sugar epimerase
VRDFNYVDDVVDAMLLAAERDEADGQIFNLGGSEPIDLKSLVELMIEIRGGGSYRFVPFPPEKKSIDIGDYYGDFSKIKATLGWAPRTSLREGLQKTFDYYKETLNWYLE